MLDGAFTSPKIRRLAVVIGVPWPHALGLAGLLWRFTAKHAPTGEIGRHDDEEIAAALEWPGDGPKLVTALVKCKLLDDAFAWSPEVRLLVHDWPDHAPRYVLATLERTGKVYSPLYGKMKRKATVVPTVVPTVEPTVEPAAAATTYTSPSTPTKASTPASVVAKAKSISVRPANGSPRSDDGLPMNLLEAVWNLWVPGRKKGKRLGLEKVRNSVMTCAAEKGVSLDEAVRMVADATRRDADAYKQKVSEGMDLKYVPLAGNYFGQERWDDNDPEPDIKSVRKDEIKNELNRARKNMGGELGSPSSAVARLDADR